MEDLTEHHQSAATETLNSITDMVPSVLLALAGRILAGMEQHSIQTVTTNVPGPRHTLYAAGCRMLNAYPYVPLSGSVGIGVATFSYAGHLTFGVTGDFESAADIDILAAVIEAGVQDLVALS